MKKKIFKNAIIQEKLSLCDCDNGGKDIEPYKHKIGYLLDGKPVLPCKYREFWLIWNSASDEQREKILAESDKSNI